ncbi:DNA processing protein DprA [Acidovorax temperans]|uniref:DNA processing protein DprA n=1 Tax=Acidovorax temperans TaxID=80878 RepID=A0A0D7KDK2_9BURK|nr:DNA-processing protein DprA [Acidovorax temperans]KJA12250.1 DNA processing protein DprA [Acidovorax temperans]
MDRDELGAWLRLATTPGIGNQTARKLLATFGLPTALFAQTEAALSQCVSERHARALVTVPPSWPELLEKTWQWLHASDLAEGTARAIITLGDVRYPKKLLDTEDPPLMLYVVGARAVVQGQPFAEGRCLAVVGSRNPTAQGADNAYQFAKALGATGLTIVSGLALGVDAAAHEGALAPIAPDRPLKQGDAPATIAVVGTGLDRVYPSRHLDLAHRIARHGLLVSEYPLGTPPLAPNFPKRNRIISGLSQGTLVVEAALASGSLITARLATEQGREVFAIPGSIHAPQSRGCHALIKQGAKLVESAQDVLEECRWALPAATSFTAGDTAVGTDEPAATVPQESALLQAMGYDPVGLDALVNRTGMDAASLQVQLLELELDGVVARLPGALFQRVGRG